MTKVNAVTATTTLRDNQSIKRKVSRCCFSVYQGFKDFVAFVLRILTCGCFRKKPSQRVSFKNKSDEESCKPSTTVKEIIPQSSKPPEPLNRSVEQKEIPEADLEKIVFQKATFVSQDFLDDFRILLQNFRYQEIGQFRISCAFEKTSALRKSIDKKNSKTRKKLCQTQDQLEIAFFLKIFCEHIVHSSKYSSKPKDPASFDFNDHPIELKPEVKKDLEPYVKLLNGQIVNFLNKFETLTYDAFCKATKGDISSLLRGYGYLKDKPHFRESFQKPT